MDSASSKDVPNSTRPGGPKTSDRRMSRETQVIPHEAWIPPQTPLQPNRLRVRTQDLHAPRGPPLGDVPLERERPREHTPAVQPVSTAASNPGFA